ncbi:hypothetical protein BH09MYX1_BH09MYX1_33390 [soil metagenome]
MSTRAILTTVTAALGVHVAIFAALPRASAWAHVTAPDPTIEVTVDVAAVAEVAPVDVAAATITDRAEARGAALSHIGTTVENTGGGDPGAVGTIEPLTASSSAVGAMPFGGIVVVPGGDRAAIGLAGHGSYRNQVATAGSVEGTPKQRFDQVLNASLLQHEREMGMLQEAPAINALEDATRSGYGPLDCSAVFSLTFDANGTVTSVGVESSSSDRGSWEDIAKKTALALVAKKVRVPNGAKGLSLRISVESKVALPSGARSPISGVGLKSDDKGNAGLGGNFDISDIGSKPTRVVGARTIGASTL